MVVLKRALADTSVFIGLEAARFDPSHFDGFEWGVSAVTLGELRLGVHKLRIPKRHPADCRLTSSRSSSRPSPWMRRCPKHGLS